MSLSQEDTITEQKKKMFSASRKYVFHIGRKQEPNMD